jgi:hypothetical protein
MVINYLRTDDYCFFFFLYFLCVVLCLFHFLLSFFFFFFFNQFVWNNNYYIRIPNMLRKENIFVSLAIKLKEICQSILSQYLLHFYSTFIERALPIDDLSEIKIFWLASA